MAQYPTRFDNGIIVYGLPSNPALGAIAVDSADGNLKKYNGATWDIVGASVPSPLGINQDNLKTTSFDSNVLGDFTYTGLVLSTVNPIKGTKSALLTHQAAINQSFKEIIAVDRKFRSKNLTLTLTNRSTAYPSNLTLTVTDETNAAVISSSQIFTDKIPFLANTASSTTISAIPSSIINYLVAGQSITGAGIPANTLIVSINTAAFTMVISNAATATATGASLNVSGLPSLRTFPFDVPATCASLSYTVTALPEANLAESYIDDVVIALTATIVLPVSTIQSVPSLKYTSASGQSVANVASNPLLFETKVFDNTGSFNAATGVWTCTLPGLYCVSAIAGLSASGTGVRWLDLYKNSAQDSRLGTGVAADYAVSGTSMISLVAGDTIFVSMYQNNGTAINLNASAVYTQLSIYRVSASTINTAQYFSQAALVQSPDSYLQMNGFVASMGSTSTQIYTFSTPAYQKLNGDAILYVKDSVNGDYFQALRDGAYSFSVGFDTNSTANVANGFGLSKNSTQLTSVLNTINDSDKLAIAYPMDVPYISWTGSLVVGDKIRVHNGGHGAGTAAGYSTLSMSYAGSLKQINPQLNNKITIPTHEVRFEGASTRGSTDVNIVKFDTQAITRGEGFSVINTAANGTAVTITKAGRLTVSGSMYTTSTSTYVIVSKNQAVLSTTPVNSEVISEGYLNATNSMYNLSGSSDVKVGDVIRLYMPNAPTATAPGNILHLYLQEQSFPLAISNIWQQNGAGFNPDNLLLQQFDTAVLGDFTQTGLNFVIANALNGAKSAQLIHQSAVSQSFKQVFQVAPKFRGKNLTLKHDILSTATSGNLTLTVTDETNSTILVNASSVPTNSQLVTATVTGSSSALTAVSNAVINGLSVGMRVTGASIPSNSYITGLSASAGTITISQTATGAGTAVRISSVVAIPKVSFDVPASCGQLSYLFTALPDSLAETYIDGMSVDITSQVLSSTSITQQTATLENIEATTATSTWGSTNTGVPVLNITRNSSVGVIQVNSDSVNGTSFVVLKDCELKITATFYNGSGAVALYITKNSTVLTNGLPTGLVGLSACPAANIEGEASAFIKVSAGDIVRLQRNAGGTTTIEYVTLTATAYSTASTTIPLMSAQLVQQPDSSIRLNTLGSGASGYGSTNTAIARFVNITESIGTDILYQDSATLGASFTALTQGIYDISWSAIFDAPTISYGISKNSTQLTTAIGSINAADRVAMDVTENASYMGEISISVLLNVGDVIRPHGTASTSVTVRNATNTFSITKQGSLKQLNASTDAKITIPTHQLRFEGASARGSTDTVIVKFDTQALTYGDAFSVANTAANGTAITMKKAGKLDIQSSIYTIGAANTSITKNQAVLNTYSSTISEMVASQYVNANAEGMLAWSGNVSIGDVFRVQSTVTPSVEQGSGLKLFLTETTIPANFSNVLPQWSQSDSCIQLRTANGYGSTNTKIRRFSNTVQNLGNDVTYTDDAVLGGYFTINTSGTYNISYIDLFTTASDFGVTLNTAQPTVSIASLTNPSEIICSATGAVGWTQTAATQIYLLAGSVLRAHTDGYTTGTSGTLESKFTISKVGKPNLTSVDVTPFVNLKLPDTNIVGEIVAYGGSSAPSNFLLCDGSAVARTGVYQDLFNVIGTNFGVGDGSTTFNLPNSKGIFLKGAGSQTIGGIVHAGTLGVTENDQMQGHFHSASTPYGIVGGGWAATGGTTFSWGALTIGSPTTDGVNGTPRTGTETKPANVAVNYIIRYMPNQTGVVTPTQQVSSDTMNFVFQSTALTGNEAVGTFNTYTYAINTNTATISATAPTQTASSMNTNGVQVFARPYNAASTTASPARVDIFIGKGLKSKQVDAYASAAKVTPLTYDYVTNFAGTDYGTTVLYNESTGVLVITGGVSISPSNVARSLGYDNTGTVASSAYFVFNASKSPSLVTIPNLIERIATISEVQASGTNGGTFTSGAMQTRTLNTIVDRSGFVTSLTSNQITLPAGEYYIEGSASAFNVNNHKAQIYNVTGAAVLVSGTSETSTTISSRSLLSGSFVLSTASAISLQHQCSTTAATNGFGVAVSLGGNEVYSILKITKIK